jgi:hypothetical protein
MQRIKARNEEGKTELSWGHPCKGHGGIDPNQLLQLTLRYAQGQASGIFGFIDVFGFAVGFGLSDAFGKSPPQLNLVVMRLRNFAYGGGLLVLLLIIAGVTLSVFRVRPMGVSIGVHSYQRQGDEVSASLVLTNTGAVSLAVPLRFGCQVDRVSGFTNYLVDTSYTVFLRPRTHVILSNTLWRVRLPSDTSAWKVNVRLRQPGGRERFVEALRRSGFVNNRMLSRSPADRGKKQLTSGSNVAAVGWRFPGTSREDPQLQKMMETAHNKPAAGKAGITVPLTHRTPLPRPA